ncbi:hypothetical protein PCANC_07912 [Puccinia coronata f. sp. avenae]|uniref:Uncharacterized protein n=1 Tax=Puccinia coronata f. sp. avenae TaxID=200324 RepID=A0A2N5UYB4_9BASI|nr:hypothetical protein PCANC_07912 [Puccinia coronata f. sp. avenae]
MHVFSSPFVRCRSGRLWLGWRWRARLPRPVARPGGGLGQSDGPSAPLDPTCCTGRADDASGHERPVAAKGISLDRLVLILNI